MKDLRIKAKASILTLILFTVAVYRSSAQSNVATNVEALKFSHEIESNITDFEINASDLKTNESILDSQKAIDRDMGGAENSIRSAIVTLKFSQVNIDREERTILWFEVLGAIDRHLGKIPGFTFNRPIRPPPGYKGKVGLGGMEMPDTNDIVDYKYYLAARRQISKNSTSRNFQCMLHSDNDSLATPYSEKFFRSSYTSEADKREFEDLLEHSKLSDAREKALKEAVVDGH